MTLTEKQGRDLFIGSAAIILALAGIIFLASTYDYRDPAPQQNLPEASLVDGKTYLYAGVFHDSPVVNGRKSFSSQKLGISFTYPEGYILFENASVSDGFDSFTISPKTEMLETITRAEAGFYGEGPASMAITFYAKPDSTTSLEEWMRTDTAHSNFDPINDPGAKASLASTTVAGFPALAWHSSLGLYASDYVAFSYKNWFVLASSAEMDAERSADFESILSSIAFK